MEEVLTTFVIVQWMVSVFTLAIAKIYQMSCTYKPVTTNMALRTHQTPLTTLTKNSENAHHSQYYEDGQLIWNYDFCLPLLINNTGKLS